MFSVIIKSLELKNYRNYEALSLELSPGTNIFFGDNAQGKTNILEAVYMCATSKSHRGSRDIEMIRFGQDDAHLCMRLEKSGVLHKIDIHLKKNKVKGIAVDGLVIKKYAQLFGVVNAVLFSPEDLGIIKNGPGERRRFIDMELCQLNKLYMSYLMDYTKVLNQRNNLLKQLVGDGALLETLDVWDMQLVRCGSFLVSERQRFVGELNEIIGDIHYKLSGGREKLSIAYEPSVDVPDYEKKLFSKRNYDIKTKTTSVGPHRDDISFLIGDIDIRRFGSQGQQRTAALSLKLAEIELVRRVTGDQPVLLLDDVLSELDSSRQNYLLESIKDIQTMITCTGLDDFVNHRFEIDRVYHVAGGEVKCNSKPMEYKEEHYE